MAKFCSVCGASIADGVKFCPGCGAPVDSAAEAPVAAATEAAPAPVAAPAKKSGFDMKNKSTWIGIAAIVIVIVLLIVLISSLGGGGYKGALKNHFSVSSKQANLVYSTVAEYGKNIKITYKITDKEKIDKDDLKKIEKSYQKKNKKAKVTDGYKVTLDMKIKGSKDDDKNNGTEINVLKIDGKWYVLGI